MHVLLEGETLTLFSLSRGFKTHTLYYVVIMLALCTAIKDTPNKEHLSIKDKSTHPNSYYTSTF